MREKKNRLRVLVGAVIFLTGVVIGYPLVLRFGHAISTRLRGRATVAQRLEQYGPDARSRLRPYFERAGVAYPPERMTLVGIKKDKALLVYAEPADGGMRFIRRYPILGASGTLGPKLREGDRQVPEGLYRIDSLNPNSRFHLSLRVNYPNDHDRQRGREDGRSDLGGDIMIHGGSCSVGCLAMGDSAAEELFVLAADTRKDNVSVLLTPVDFRFDTMASEDEPKYPWLNELYQRIRTELATLPSAISHE